MDQPYLRSDTQLIQRTIPWIQCIIRSDRQAVKPIATVELPIDETEGTDQSRQNSGFGGESTDSAVQKLIDRDVERKLIVSSLDAGDSTWLNSNPEPIDSPLIKSEPDLLSLLQIDRSPYAGFFSIIPLLNQLGFFHRCNRLSLNFPAHLLSQVAMKFGIPDVDPIRQALTTQSPNSFFGHVDPLAEITPEITAWIAAMRFWCRRYVGMKLTEIIDRPGAFTLTRTHLDIYFHHDQADIWIRRSGLDLDPGWVPWLGRVVLFHYGNGA